MLDWIGNNRQWLLSGVAVALPLAVIGWFLSRSKKIRQKQKSGSGSINIQAGGNISLDSREETKDD